MGTTLGTKKHLREREEDGNMGNFFAEKKTSSLASTTNNDPNHRINYYRRGPDKYDRNWEDEQAYMVKQNVAGRRGKKKSFGKDEFPPLPNRESF